MSSCIGCANSGFTTSRLSFVDPWKFYMCVTTLVYLVVCRWKKMELFSFIAFEKAKNIGAIMDESYSRCFIRLIYIYTVQVTRYALCGGIPICLLLFRLMWTFWNFSKVSCFPFVLHNMCYGNKRIITLDNHDQAILPFIYMWFENTRVHRRNAMEGVFHLKWRLALVFHWI